MRWISAKWIIISLAGFEASEEILEFQVTYRKEGVGGSEGLTREWSSELGLAIEGFYDIQRSFANSIVRLFPR